MKKFLLLLFSMLLLFPVAIYFGNLADVPASKKAIIYLRDLVGMSTTKVTTDSDKTKILKIPTPYNHVGLVESWRNLGIINFADLLQIISAPGKYEAWQTSIGSFLGDPLHSMAFFSSSWSFWQTKQEKLSLIGYYQPWIDVLMLIQTAEVNGNYKAVAIGITAPENTINPTTATAMAHELSTRLQRAEQAFQTTANNPDAIDEMLNPVTIKKSETLLNQYTDDLRNKLATNSTEYPSLAILAWLDAVRAGQIEEVQELTSSISNEWLKQLQPVQLIKIDAEHWLLAASDNTQAERVLLAELHIAEHKAIATEVRLWDAATVGVTQ
jgi:hypothetical protein